MYTSVLNLINELSHILNQHSAVQSYDTSLLEGSLFICSIPKIYILLDTLYSKIFFFLEIGIWDRFKVFSTHKANIKSPFTFFFARYIYLKKTD